jgi:glycosyltransferase involved in cell wall biosynthesis
LGLREEDPVLGNVARLVPMKDHQTLLRAVALVRERYPQVKCLLIGDGPLREDLERQVRQAGLSGSVLFLGHQAHIADYLALCDVAVLSSKHTEGCSNFLLEAMYCGRPIVTTDVGGAREIVVHGETGWIVDKEDPCALADAICLLLGDEQVRRTFGRAGRQRVTREFLLDKMIRKTEEVYEQLLWRRLRDTPQCAPCEAAAPR